MRLGGRLRSSFRGRALGGVVDVRLAEQQVEAKGVEACREIRDALRAMIDTGAETYINDNRDGDAREWDENDLDEPTGYEPMTLPSEARDILLEQLKRLDKLAETADSAGLCAGTDALYSISQSMCAIAKELRE